MIFVYVMVGVTVGVGVGFKGELLWVVCWIVAFSCCRFSGKVRYFVLETYWLKYGVRSHQSYSFLFISEVELVALMAN